MCSQTVSAWSELLSRKEIQASEIVAYYQTRIQEQESQIKGFLRFFDPPIQSQETKYSIPIAIKDNICIQDQPTTCASRILENYQPPFHATVSERLLDVGVSIMGKTNLDEFAMGSSTENSAFQKTCNPWNTDYVPGGSSGGSAAVVAAEEVPWSLGSDTGGSIRLPAAFCGVVGMKPTYGRVSRYGLIAYASSLDQIGPITRNVKDNALLLNLISGFDAKDSTSAQLEYQDFGCELGDSISGKKLGVPKEMLDQGIDSEVRAAFEKSLAVFTALGAEIVEISLPTIPYSLATYYLIATSEASSNLARYDGVLYGHRAQQAGDLNEMYFRSRSEGFGDEVKLRIMLGTFALSSGYYDAYYRKAQQARTLLIQEFNRAFEEVDAFITPTSPVTSFPFGERSDDPLHMYMTDVLTVSANLTGVPAISIPCGFSTAGLPIGLQLMGKALSESELYQLAYAYEQATDWHLQTPEGQS